MQERKFDCDRFVENFKRNLDKPEVKKLNRIEKSLNDNIARIECILEGLKSDFNYIKNMPDNCVQKSSFDDKIMEELEIKFAGKPIKILSLEEVTIEIEKLKLVIDKLEKRVEELEFIVEIRQNRNWTK